MFGWVGHDRVLHVVAGDGHELRRVANIADAYAAVFSPSGDRIGALGEHEMIVYDTAVAPGQVRGRRVPRDRLGHPADPRRRHVGRGAERHRAPLSQGRPRRVVAGHAVRLGGDGARLGDTLVVLGTSTPRWTFSCTRAPRSSRSGRCRARSVQFGANGAGVGYQCGEQIHLMIGRAEVGAVPFDSNALWVTRDRASQRTAALDGDELDVFDPAGAPIAKTRERTPGAWRSRTPIISIVAVPRQALWRWTLPIGAATERWEQLATIDDEEASPRRAGRIGVLGRDLFRRARAARPGWSRDRAVARRRAAARDRGVGRRPARRGRARERRARDRRSRDLDRRPHARSRPRPGLAEPSFDATDELVVRTGLAHRAVGLGGRDRPQPRVQPGSAAQRHAGADSCRTAGWRSPPPRSACSISPSTSGRRSRSSTTFAAGSHSRWGRPAS